MSVLDASALLAYVLDEPGADLVETAMVESAAVGTVNLAEVLTKLADVGVDPGAAMVRIGALPVDAVAFDEELAVETARLRPLTAAAGLSLGDRACLALGLRLGRPVLTADAAWRGLVPGVEVCVIR
jgi:PIN domain nuclease of toxin-antitoxin system